MKYIFPFNASATNVLMLITISLSYICFPILAFIATHAICGFFSVISTYWQQFSASMAFLLVSIYSLCALVTMHISFFRGKRKNKR